MKNLGEFLDYYYAGFGPYISSPVIESSKYKQAPAVLKYQFLKGIPFSDFFSESLIPPFGENLPAVLYQQKELRDFFAQMIFDTYGLTLNIDNSKKQISLLKLQGHFSSSTYFNMISDTLQRLIFYCCAIASNTSRCLIFEEPEVHSFPPFLSIIADRIARDEKNQYFITTHSPYLLNTILGNTNKDDVAVHIVDYVDFQTQVRRFTDEEISEVLSYGPEGSGMDVFFNLEKFPVNG